MNKKTRNFIIIGSIIAVIIGSILMAFPNNKLYNVAGITPQLSMPDFFLLSVDPNQNTGGSIICYLQHEMHATTTQGKTVLVAFNQEGSFDPNLITGDILDQYGTTLDHVDGELLLKCNPLPSAISTINAVTADGGTYHMVLYGYNTMGHQVQLFDSGFVSIPANQIVSGKTITIGTWTLINSEIQSKLGTGNVSYKSQLQGFMSAKLDFKYGFAKQAQFQYTTTTSAPILFNVQVTTPESIISQINPFIFAQASVSLTDPVDGNVNQKTTSLIRGAGVIQGYDSSIGVPKVEVYYTDPNANIQQTSVPALSQQLTQFTKSGNNAIFPFAIPAKSLLLGTYTIKFYSDRSNVAVTSFNVKNFTPVPPTTTPVGTGSGSTGGTSSGIEAGNQTISINNIPNNGNGNPSNPATILNDLSNCINNGDTSCLSQGEFIPVYVVLIVVIMIIAAVVGTNRSS